MVSLIFKKAKGISDHLPLRTEKWQPIIDRITDGVLRILFCSGLSEAMASVVSPEAAYVVASSRFVDLLFWDLVALGDIESSTNARDKAVNSVECWGLCKGAIASLYALLFSSKPVPSLQFATYALLSTEPVSLLAIYEDILGNGTAIL